MSLRNDAEKAQGVQHIKTKGSLRCGRSHGASAKFSPCVNLRSDMFVETEGSSALKQRSDETDHLENYARGET